MTFIKICGVTRPDDALSAAALGAQALGLNFYARSKRVVSIDQARAIAAAVPPFVWLVGVFVNASNRVIERTVRAVGLHAVQLHGDEGPEQVTALRTRGLTTLKALHLGHAPVPPGAFVSANALVLDAAQPGYGGGGVRFDWKLARAVTRRRPVLLAGGLTPENVVDALRAVRPFGVDVASGVERSPGIKDSRRMAAFIRAVRAEEKPR